jgi:serine/threonine-protein kinase
MGIVMRGHDPELGRDLAVKVQLARTDATVHRRFLEEARIVSRLEHPGVVPIHEIGRLDDGTPFFAMKLVAGRTLTALLEDRPNVGHVCNVLEEEAHCQGARQDLPRFLKIFEQVCETMAYAHSHGVIHRDLKPGNVMVGAFGEVQVMDWGLAKVLVPAPSSSLEDGTATGPIGPGITKSPTSPSGSTIARQESQHHTQAGSIIGTVAYMAPEQARGEALDERADVFSLGAILCQILTGTPPFGWGTSDEMLPRVCAGQLEAARSLLNSSGADAELVRLTRACLQPQRENRPANAGEVAAAISSYLTGVQDRLRRAEVERAATEFRAKSERRSRRLLAGLAAATLVSLVIGWAAREKVLQARAAVRAEHTRAIEGALHEANLLRNEARKHLSDPARWQTTLHQANLAVTRAAELIDETTDVDHLREQSARLLEEVAEDERDRLMVVELERVRQIRSSVHDGRFDIFGVARGYENAFRAYGADISRQEIEGIVSRLRSRPILPQLGAGLDDWASLSCTPRDRRKKLIAVVQKVAPDPLLDPLRGAFAQRDVAALEKLAVEIPVEKVPPGSLVHLADALAEKGRMTLAADLLARACERYPGDFWVTHQFAYHLSQTQPPPLETVARYYSAAAAIRPDSPGVFVNLSSVLLASNRNAEAATAASMSIALKKDYAEAYGNLGNALAGLGRDADAAEAFTTSLRYKPDLHQSKLGLAWVAFRASDFVKAERLAHEVVQARPHMSAAWGARGQALAALGSHDEAIACYREGLRLSPNYPKLLLDLADSQFARGKYRSAVSACQHVLLQEPQNLQALKRQGLAFYHLAEHAKAGHCFRTARILMPEDPVVTSNLASCLLGAGSLNEARKLCERVLQAMENPVLHFVLGRVHLAQGRTADAADCFRTYLAKCPDQPDGLLSLGQALFRQNELDDAAAALSKATSLRRDVRDYYWLARVLRARRQYYAARMVLDQAAELDDRHAEVHLERGLLLLAIGESQTALAAIGKALGRTDWNELLQWVETILQK